ncbi:hypothetical protein [Leptodesmis sichuanensis]|uniref:hypothetical protein n=1 Tax=Leptodesmis sichuanensis TaxID=2906798 RepID=UPI001F474810|nr:hypothetical protein [Leptodesmis sichuanensis]UIE38168.1 hypothetical protein KIK02_00435 [Leptodesmis sichuanensis A121]
MVALIVRRDRLPHPDYATWFLLEGNLRRSHSVSPQQKFNQCLVPDLERRVKAGDRPIVPLTSSSCFAGKVGHR